MPGFGKSGTSRISCLSVFKAPERNSIVARMLQFVQHGELPPGGVPCVATPRTGRVPQAFQSRKPEPARRLRCEPTRAAPFGWRAPVRKIESRRPEPVRRSTSGERSGRRLQRVNVRLAIQNVFDGGRQFLQRERLCDQCKALLDDVMLDHLTIVVAGHKKDTEVWVRTQQM